MGSSGRWAAVVGLLGGCGSAPADASAGRCGDAIVQPGEACDDGNHREGDGCNGDCRRSGRRQWCVQPEVGSEGSETTSVRPIALVGFADGLVVAVEIGDAQTDVHARLIALDPSGAPLWTHELASPDDRRLRVRDLALGPAGATVLVVAAALAEDPVDRNSRTEAWISELELEHGATIHARRHADPHASLQPSTIATTDSAVLLAGSAGAEGWLARFDHGLELAWEQRFDPHGVVRSASVVPLADGRVAIAGTVVSATPPADDDAPISRVFVRVYGPDGELERDVAPAGLASAPHELVDAIAWDSGVLLGGSRGSVFPASQLWWFDGDAQVHAVWDPADPDRLIAALLGVDSGVLAAGSKDQAIGPVAQWLARLGPELRASEPSWQHVGPPGELLALAAAPSEPAIYAAALTPRAAGGSDTAICKFSE